MLTNVSQHGVAVDGQMITWGTLREALAALAQATDSVGMVQLNVSGDVKTVDPIARYCRAVMTDASEIVSRIAIASAYLSPEPAEVLTCEACLQAHLGECEPHRP